MIDKCLCIKDYCDKFNKPIFKKCEIYEFTDQEFATRKYPDGYNVCFFNHEYIYFRKNQDTLTEYEYEYEYEYDLFSTYFKTLKQIRKEKLTKIDVQRCL